MLRNNLEREEVELLREQNELLRRQIHQLARIERNTEPKHLRFIKLAIGGIMPVGPATLTVGDKRTVSVLGFDQNGAPIAIDFNANPVSFTDDNQAVVSDAPSGPTDTITAVSAGVANISATCGGFADTEAVTVLAAAPVLSSIKISID